MKKLFLLTIPVMLLFVVNTAMANTCEPFVWQIGDVEAAQMDNPCDEFNYPTIVYGEQDFYPGTTPTNEFPWISRYDKNYAPTINIHFNADLPNGGVFSFSWSPGASGTETITVTLSLDGTETLGTVTRDGIPNPAWWGNYERFIESFDVPSITGDHILTITFSSGDGSVWDWLKLERICAPVTCPEGTIQEHVETVTVLSDGSIVSSVNVLQSGITYLFEASGTYTYWPAQLPDAGIADAKYSLRPEGNNNPGPGPQWISGDDLASPWTNYLEVLVDSGPVSWGAFNLAHEYYLLLDGTGSTVGFKILDSYYGDNSGSLQVDIYKCVSKCCPVNIEVENDNWAEVRNEVTVTANTGKNDANGGDGGDGGDTGHVKAQKGGDATSGNGGTGGAGGDGGDINTGNAYAKAKVVNITNTNITRVNSRNGCCNGDAEVEVENDDNDAMIFNDLEVEADTGKNDANGGEGGDGGDAGYVKAQKGGTAITGNGGTGGAGGDSYTITTGNARAKAKVFTVTNTNITRIRVKGYTPTLE